MVKIDKKLSVWILFIVIIFFLLKPYLVPSILDTVKVDAQNGMIDFDGHFDEKKAYALSGELSFYPNALLTHEDFIDPDPLIVKIKESIQFPSAWKSDKNVNFATYRLIIKGIEPNKKYGLHLLDALTAFNVFVDGNLIASNGIVSTSTATGVPESRPMVGLFSAPHDQVEIIFQVSNYTAHLTGIWQKTVFASEDVILEYQDKAIERDVFFIGGLFLMFIYHFILYAIIKRDHAILYFAIFCSLVAIKSLFSGQQVGFSFYPFINYDLGLRLAYLTIPLMAICFLEFVHCCFPNEVSQKYVKWSWLISGAQTLVILFLPQALYQSTFNGYQAYIFISCGMIIFWVIKAVLHGREGSMIYLLGFISFFIVAFNDILYTLLVIKTGYYLSIGLFFLIISQATILSLRFRDAILTVENLKNSLEERVYERTEQLKQERNTFENLSKIDSLTLVYNKRFLTEALNIEYESFKRYQGIFSIIMIDLDHFKSINDTYGHMVGDTVLVAFCEMIRNNTRRTDIFGRFGGDEFLIIMRYTGIAEATIHAEKLRGMIELLEFKNENRSFSITASFGVTEVDSLSNNERDVLKKADEALYIAKAKGRNTVESF